MFIKYNWPGILWLIFILLLTGVPGNYFPQINRFWDWLGPDKIIHLFLFGVFEYTLLRGFQKQYQFLHLRRNFIVYALVTGMVFGAFTEVMQRYLTTGRNANIYDFLANLLGCMLGFIAYYVINRKLNKISDT